MISYYDYIPSYDLKVAHCNNTACTRATTTLVVGAGEVVVENAITLGNDGLPLVTYYESAYDDLKVVHCSNPFCVPFFRRR